MAEDRSTQVLCAPTCLRSDVWGLGAHGMIAGSCKAAYDGPDLHAITKAVMSGTLQETQYWTGEVK